MIELNLLPPQEKTAAYLMWKYVIIKNIILIILVLTFVISGVLFGAKLILLNKFAEVQRQAEAINITHQKINTEVTNYNKQIRTLDKIQTDYTSWPELLYNINKSITPGITLSQIEIDISQKLLTLNGVANTRNDLLGLKDSLEKCKLTKEIVLPLNTLLKKQNVDFSISVELINFICNDESQTQN